MRVARRWRREIATLQHRSHTSRQQNAGQSQAADRRGDGDAGGDGAPKKIDNARPSTDGGTK